MNNKYCYYIKKEGVNNLLRRIFFLLAIFWVLTEFGLRSDLAFASLRSSSDNYQMGNVNFGHQMFISTTEYSAPLILGSGPEVVEISPFSAKIKWFTDKPSSSSVFFGTQSGVYDTESSKAYDNETVHIIELNNLDPKVSYFYIVRSKDSAGNMGQSEEKEFKTPLPNPVVNNLAIDAIEEKQATVKFGTDYFAISTVDCINPNNLEKITVGEPGFAKDHEIILNNLVSDQLYSCNIVARDEEGNESNTSSIEFRTLRDASSPIIENVKFDFSVDSNKSKVRGTIAWKTNEDSASRVKYKENGSDEFIVSEEVPDLVKNHFLVIPDLNPQTTYKIVAVSSDSAGNQGVSEEFVVLTPKQKRTFLQIIIENIQQIFEPFGRLFE
ncbi:MAG: hypothetical protein BWY19_01102 [bacterium ADurb.Bin212]|nr:MAG: hypothetical protein BWY19_01102 [bacterium ADurb.Bin212]